MKKIISIFTVTCMLIAMFVPFVSAASDNVEIITVTYTSTGDEFILTVKGVTTPKKNVSLTVKNVNSEIRALEQVRAGDDGSFVYEIGVEITEDKGLVADPALPIVYTLHARNYRNATDSYVVPLYSNEAKQRIVDKFNDATTTETMTDCIDSYNETFGFNMAYYQGNEDAIANNLIAAKNAEKLTLDNISKSFDKAVVVTKLFVSDAGADRTEIIEHTVYGTMLEFNIGFDGADSLYPEYKVMTDAEKKTVNSVVFAEDNKKFDFVELKEEFFMAVTGKKFTDNKEDYTVIYEFLKSHNDWFKLENLEDLKSTEIAEIISGILDEEFPDNKADFVKLYDKYYEDATEDGEPVKKPVTDGSGGSSGGSGGGGGGMISSGTGEIGYEPKPEIKPENKPAQTLSFNDMKGYEWANDAVLYLAGKGIVNGKAEGEFAPSDNITREEFAKILVLSYGLYDENAECEFKDAENRWSYKYVASLYKYGVVQGYPDGNFGVNNLISREDMAVMLYRILLNKLEIDHEVPMDKTFKDKESISEYALNSVLMLSANGVIAGDDTGNFNPKKGATRAEACQMIYNSIAGEGGSK